MALIRCITVFLLLALSACAMTGEQRPPASSNDTLTLLHLNDTYRIDAVEEGRRGGFGRVATLVRRLQAAGNDVRILHGGDFLYPSLESQLWDGEQMVEALNFLDDLAPMYVVPGNHEFDPRAPDEIVKRIRESRFEWLADNIALATGEADVDERLRGTYIVTAAGRTIGIFALTVTPEDGGNERDYTPFASGTYIDIAERSIRALEAQDVDLIIGLTHLYVTDDIEVAKLRAGHPKFMLILGGHEHEPEYREGSAANAVIIKGASNARTIWQVDVKFTAAGPQIAERQVEIDETIAFDPEYQVIADKWRARLLEMNPFLPSRIGDAAVPLDGREVAIRNGDTTWGIFIADQMRSAFRNPPADLAFVNGGTLRIDDFIAEDITFEDIARTFGFSSYLRYMTMSGADFRELLEAGYRGIGPSKGYFPQISGFRVCVDRSRPNGERIVQMQLPTVDAGWKEIEAQRGYTVVVPDFLYGGGDGYDFSKARNVSRPGSELKFLVLDAVIRAQAAGEKVGAPLDTASPRFAQLQPGQTHCF